jgi:oligosaccharide repeat unit polymerase
MISTRCQNCYRKYIQVVESKIQRLHLRIPVGALVQFLIIVLLVSFITGYFVYDWPAEMLIYPVCFFIVVLFIWSVISWTQATNSLFDPYVLFLTAAMLFNGGKALLEVFNLNQYGIGTFTDYFGHVLFSFSSTTILQTLLLVSLGLASFHFGALLAATNKVSYLKKSSPSEISFPSARSIHLVGLALLLISLIPTIILLYDAIKTVISSGYYALFQRQGPTGFGATPRVLSTFLVPAALFLLASGKGPLKGLFVSSVVIVSYSAIYFFLGSRAFAVMPLIAYAWLWHRRVCPLPKKTSILAAVLMLFFVFPLVYIIRNNAGIEKISLPFLVDNFRKIENPAVDIASEMGSSMMTVAHTIELVPSEREFDCGMGYIHSILTIMPNFFWEIHPTIARGSAANWLVSTVSPRRASEGGGYGFSFIAEAYLNFGWIGLPVFLAAIGFLFARFILWAIEYNDPARLATVASFSSFLFLFARGESTSIIRPLVWYAIFPYLLACALTIFLRKSSHDSRHNA